MVLGEAGSGKTTEFALTHEALAAQGRLSFAISVEDLATLGIDGSFGGDEQGRFEAWKASEAEAFFFLDSVDEAHLNGKKLSIALRRLANEVRPAQQRARIVISCRVSDWRAHTDRRTIETILFPPSGPQASPSTPNVRVYSLVPLHEAQVAALALAAGVANAAEFSSAAKRAGAHAYLERPRDVEWLAAYWQVHGEIGSLTNLVEHDVLEKLVERNPSRQPRLTLARARQAAETLAGVLTLERRATIRLPDGDLDPERAANALDPVRVLPDFSREELSELLTLPLFDEATYGRVRIHHRSITEFLAAQWFLRLLKNGMAESELTRLLFRPGPDGPVVPAELAATAAWLAGASVAIRQQLLTTAPTVLLQAGDPNSLPDETRREILLAIARRYSTRERLFESFDPVMLRRLATGTIADTITALLDSSTQQELLNTLLGIVEEGGLAQCAESALRIACDGAAALRARTAAIAAVASVGTDEQHERLLVEVIDRSDEIDHNMGGALVGLYPNAMSVDRLIVFISRVKGPPPNTGTLLPFYLGRDVPTSSAPAEKLRIIQAVLEEVQLADNPNAYRAQRQWLLNPLVRMIADFVSHRGELMLDAIVPTVRFFARIGPGGRLDRESGGDKIRRVVDGDTDLKRQIFWSDVEAMDSNPTSFFDLLKGDRLWTLGEQDGEWLARDARSRATESQRLLAFDCLLRTPIPDGATDVRQRVVDELAAADPVLKARLVETQARTYRSEPQQLVAARKRRREEKENETREENRRWLTDRIEGLRDGSEIHTLTKLAVQYSLDGEKPDDAIMAINKEFGERIANAARNGWVRMWRGLRCPLPHEERGSFNYVMVAGFAGITLEVNNGLDLARLSQEEAVAAARFASRAMSHFPTWLEALASKQPAAVIEIFGECIEADFQMKPEDQPAHAVLALLSHAGDEVRRVCAPLVLDLLRGERPQRLDSLKNSIEIVVATSTIHTEYLRLVGEQCRANREDVERYALWWSGWLAADASSAIDELFAALRTVSDADLFILGITDQLWLLVSDRVVSFPMPEDIDQLGRLARIVFTHIRPDEDLRHVGGYSPGPRDHAQSLRNGILNTIENSSGEAAYRALRSLAAEPVLKTWQDYLLSLSDKRLALDAGAYDPSVAMRLIGAFERYGLDAVNHLKEAGLMTTSADIGILTIRDDEFQAVLAAFPVDLGIVKTNNRHYNIRRADAGGGKDYRVAILRLSEQGNGEAGDAARDLIEDLKPRMILVVGIGSRQRV